MHIYARYNAPLSFAFSLCIILYRSLSLSCSLSLCISIYIQMRK